jgi:RND family efflux transporter MFP subunit
MISLSHVSLQAPIVHGETLDCLIEPFVVVNVGTAVEGVLDTVTVDRGDLVKQGQVLARLESNAERATVARFRAKADIEAPIKIKQARLELSTLQYSRSEGLYQKAIIADDDMDEAKTTKRLAELNLLEAMENQHLAELDLRRVIAELNRRTIKSPITGVVVDRLRHPGEFADENPILTLAQMHPLRVEVFAPVMLLGQVEVGMRAEVMPEPPVGGVHEARVITVDRVVDAASGMFGVRLKLPNRSYRLPAGLKCQVRFQMPSDQRAQESDWLSVPSSESGLPPVVDKVEQGETASGGSSVPQAQESDSLSVPSSQSRNLSSVKSSRARPPRDFSNGPESVRPKS